MNIRSAKKADGSRVSEIYLSSRKRFLCYAPLVHSDDEVLTWVFDTLIPSGGLTIVESEAGILGFLGVSRDVSFSWIDHLYLDPSYIGLGLGSALVDEAKRLLPAPIRLYTVQENGGARRFYERHEFRDIGYSDGARNEEKAPDVLMEWR